MSELISMKVKVKVKFINKNNRSEIWKRKLNNSKEKSSCSRTYNKLNKLWYSKKCNLSNKNSVSIKIFKTGFKRFYNSKNSLIKWDRRINSFKKLLTHNKVKRAEKYSVFKSILISYHKHITCWKVNNLHGSTITNVTSTFLFISEKKYKPKITKLKTLRNK